MKLFGVIGDGAGKYHCAKCYTMIQKEKWQGEEREKKNMKLDKVFSGRVFDVFRKEVFHPEHGIQTREIVHHPGAVAIAPMLSDTEIVLVRVFRGAIGQFFWEIPAGTREPEETAIYCANRELNEETGYKASKMMIMGVIYPSPGYTDEGIIIYKAEHLTPTYDKIDDEVTEVKVVTLGQAVEMIEKDEISDAKTIIGIGFVRMGR